MKTRHSQQQSPKLFGSLIASCIISTCALSANTNITNDIYGLKNTNKADADTFFATSTTTYNGTNTSFTQSYSNGTLILGNNTASTGSGTIWFGQGGLLGYITANFNAKEIYLTGTLGAGNSFKTGGGAELNFNASDNITLQDWNLKFTNAGLQKSNAFLTAGKTLSGQNITILDETGGSIAFSAANFELHAKSIQTNGGTLTFKNTTPTTSEPNTITIDSLKLTNAIFDAKGFSGELAIKDLAATNTNFDTAHFSAENLNASTAAFLQTRDDADGYAALTLTGNYTIQAAALNTGATHMSFNKLTSLTADTLTAGTWGAYAASITLTDVKNAMIKDLRLQWYTSADTAYPTFDSSKSQNANITISSLFMRGGVLKTAKNGTLDLQKIDALQSTIDAVGINAASIDWSEWTLSGTQTPIQASYRYDKGKLTLTGLLKPRKILSFEGESLDATKARFEVNGQVLDTSRISGEADFASLNLTNAITTFNDFNLISGGDLSYSGKSRITIKGNLDIKGVVNFFIDGRSLSPIMVEGRTDIYFDAKDMGADFIAKPLFNVYNLRGLKGLKIGTQYTLLRSNGGITYHYTSQSGETSSGNDLGYQANMLDRVGFYETLNSPRLDNDLSFKYNGIVITKTADATSIGFKIDTESSLNPYDKNRIEYWFFRKGGREWIDAINGVSGEVMEYFQTLMIDKNNALWANDIITPNDLDFFLQLARKMDSAANQLGSTSRKSSSIDAVRLATDVNRNSRLVKLSSTIKEDNSFAQIIKRLQNRHFAQNEDSTEGGTSQSGVNEGIASDALPSNIYQVGMREEYKNNVWGTAIGAVNFVQGGNGTLYGINLGYDRFINNVIVGGYVAYAYSNYFGDLIQNNGHNLNLGFYTRAFLDNHEFDLTLSQTIGFNQEFIDSKELITQQLNQHYSYNSFITNLNFNYGYLFYLQNNTMVLKPQVGLSYFFIANSDIQGKTSDAFYKDLLANANADNKQVIALNVALETRKYIDANSYWYVLAGTSQDLFVYSQGDESIRFIGNNTLAYRKNTAKNLYLSLTIGGEMEVYERVFINFGLGSKLGIFYKDIGISGNLGMRYIF